MKRISKIKQTDDGRAMLNLGCGPRTHGQWNNVDFSPYARLSRHRRLARSLRRLGLLSDARYRNVLEVDPAIIHWDVRRGVPFEDEAFDVVYHSHFIPHVDRRMAAEVTAECRRVLRPGGTLRVVVPDLEAIVGAYVESIRRIARGLPEGWRGHAEAVDELFELMVRREACGTSRQRPIVRAAERLLRGGVERTGELRRWHYDQFSMGAMIRQAGFRDAWKTEATHSRIDGWDRFGLDVNADGSVYKPGSLYMEAAA